MATKPTAVKVQCFHCDASRTFALDAIPFANLRDYACPDCRRTGTCHVVRVETKQEEAFPLTALLRRQKAGRLPWNGHTKA